MTTQVLESIELRQLRLPLIKPYRLAFGVQTDFNTVLVKLTTADGAHGFGEATLIPGYTDETVEASWASAGELAQALAGGTVEAARDALWAAWACAPFTATAFLTALDVLEAHPPSPGRQRPSRHSLGIVERSTPAHERVNQHQCLTNGFGSHCSTPLVWEAVGRGSVRSQGSGTDGTWRFSGAGWGPTPSASPGSGTASAG